MKIKYIHFSEPETEKIYDTVKVFNNLSNPHVHDTQEEFDAFELKHFATDKELGIIISYEVLEDDSTNIYHNSTLSFWIEWYMDNYKMGLFSLEYLKESLIKLENTELKWALHPDRKSYYASVDALRIVIDKIKEGLQ